MAGSEDKQSLSDKELALLALLAEEPAHAYRVESKIRERSMDVWADIAQSSVYRVLQGLKKRGLIETSLEDAGQGPPRKVYAITEPARELLRSTIVERLAGFDTTCRDPYYVPLSTVLHAPHDQVVDALRVRLAKVVTQLERYDTDVSDHFEQVEALIHSEEHEPGLRDRKLATASMLMGLLFQRGRRQVEAERDALQDALDLLDSDESRALFGFWQHRVEERGATQNGGEVAPATEVDR